MTTLAVNQRALSWFGRRRFERSQVVVAIALAGLVVGLGTSTTAFLSTANLTNLADQVAIAGPIALGMTLVLLVREIDLSVASILAFSGVMIGVQIEAGVPGPVAMVLVIGIGIGLGAVNGALVGYGGVNSFMVTLAMLSMARGAALALTNGEQIAGLPESVRWLGTEQVGALPISAIVTVVAFAVGGVFLSHSRLGRNFYAVGANPEASRIFGLATGRVVFIAFMVSGALAALGGILVTARLQAASPIVATGWELTAITAAVLGGTSLLGGKGTALGTFLGVCFLVVLTNGLSLLGVSPFYTLLISGLLILGVIVIDRVRRRQGIA